MRSLMDAHFVNVRNCLAARMTGNDMKVVNTTSSKHGRVICLTALRSAIDGKALKVIFKKTTCWKV